MVDDIEQRPNRKIPSTHPQATTAQRCHHAVLNRETHEARGPHVRHGNMATRHSRHDRDNSRLSGETNPTTAKPGGTRGRGSFGLDNVDGKLYDLLRGAQAALREDLPPPVQSTYINIRNTDGRLAPSGQLHHQDNARGGVTWNNCQVTGRKRIYH